MFKKLLIWFEGYLCLYIKGYSIERFINLCKAKGYRVWSLHRTETGYDFYMALKDYRKIRPIARKTNVVPYIKRRLGLPFFLHRYRKRKGLFIGCGLFLAILYTLSLFIWDIGIEGGYKYTNEALLKFVNSKEIYSGMLKSKVNCQEIEEQIRLKYSDISWVSAEVKGTRLIIKFTETNMPVPKQVLTDPSNIIATKDGIVMSMITRCGTPKVGLGDVVHKGDVLVSGLVDIVGDFDALLRTKQVVADADIICKTYYEYEESFPMKYIQKNYSGKTKRGFAIQLINKKIYLYSPRISYKEYDIITDESILKFSSNFYLPFRYQISTYQEYESVEKVYTKDEATSIAMSRLERYLQYLVENDVKILENNVKIQMKNSNCIASGKIIVEEACWQYEEIDENEWREFTPNELNGNDD